MTHAEIAGIGAILFPFFFFRLCGSILPARVQCHCRLVIWLCLTYKAAGSATSEAHIRSAAPGVMTMQSVNTASQFKHHHGSRNPVMQDATAAAPSSRTWPPSAETAQATAPPALPAQQPTHHAALPQGQNARAPFASAQERIQSTSRLAPQRQAVLACRDVQATSRLPPCTARPPPLRAQASAAAELRRRRHRRRWQHSARD